MDIKRTFTRREMYDLVWSTPISKLASDFGISDRGLGKTCERHLIPVPGRGYWAKVEAGQPATKTPLWKIENPRLETLTVGGIRRNGTYAAATRESTQKVAEERVLKRPLAIDVPRKAVPAKAAKAAVALTELTTPHPSIKLLLSQLRTAKADEIGGIGISGVKINQLSRPRVTTFLNHVAAELEILGVGISPGPNSITAMLGGEAIAFRVTEKTQRVKHVPTEAELEKKRRFDKSTKSEWQVFFSKKFWPDFDYFHDGKLEFEIDNYAGGARKRWTDGKTQTLESLLPSIVEGVHLHLTYERVRREESEARERQRIHLSHRRELQKKRADREQQRLDFLRKLAAYQREAADLRQTLDIADAVDDSAPAEYRRMIEWARERLERISSQNEISVLSETLKANNLFPEADPFHDPEGDPPPKQNSWDP